MTANRTADIATEARRILLEKLIADPRLNLPESVIERAGHVRFVPENVHPFIPSLLKFSESSSALWALAGLFSDAIAQNRYGLPPQSVTLDVYSASMFLMSTYMFKAENGESIWDPFLRDRITHLDFGNLHESYRRAATNMYKAKDGVFFHLHGSLNPTNTFTMLDLPQHRLDLQGPEHYNTVLDIFKDVIAQRDSRWLDIESNEYWRQAGTICYTPEQFRLTSHGKAMENEPIYNVDRIMGDIPPVAWPTVDSRYRPLAGINVLDLSRVVAGPTISSILALLGANVLRISSHTLPDTIFLYDTQIGKRDTSLNLKTPEGKLKLKQLLEDADVMVDGYRPGALEKLGFSRNYVQEVARRRGRGIVHLRECCYGWKGEWTFRSGWQQISDALTGTPWIQGKYFGLDEPVIPLLPNSDYQTGIIGAISVCQALLQRATVGGSYNVDVSLTQFNLWYLGLDTYDNQTHHELLRMNPGFSARHDTELHPLVAKVEMLSRRSQGEGKGKMYDPKRFTKVHMNWGKDNEFGVAVDWRRIVQLEGEGQGPHTELGYDRGTCIPGSHLAQWRE